MSLNAVPSPFDGPAEVERQREVRRQQFAGLSSRMSFMMSSRLSSIMP